jgi:hypothetical protein
VRCGTRKIVLCELDCVGHVEAYQLGVSLTVYV